MTDQFVVSCYHSSPRYCLDKETVDVQKSGDKFYVNLQPFGCSRDYATPREAIYGLLIGHACKAIVIEPTSTII